MWEKKAILDANYNNNLNEMMMGSKNEKNAIKFIQQTSLAYTKLLCM